MLEGNGQGGRRSSGQGWDGLGGRSAERTRAPLVLERVDAKVDKLRPREKHQDEAAREHYLKHADALAACSACKHSKVSSWGKQGRRVRQGGKPLLCAVPAHPISWQTGSFPCQTASTARGSSTSRCWEEGRGAQASPAKESLQASGPCSPHQCVEHQACKLPAAELLVFRQLLATWRLRVRSERWRRRRRRL